MYYQSLFLKFINYELLNFLKTTDPIQDLIAVLFPSSLYNLWFVVCALGLACLQIIIANHTADITTAYCMYFCLLSLQQLHRIIIAFA